MKSSPNLQAQPSQSFTTPAADESRLWEGLHQFLLALARVQRVTVFIDDVQWADASTLALLGYLAGAAAYVVQYRLFH